MLRRPTIPLVPVDSREGFALGTRTVLRFSPATAVWGFVTGVAMVNAGLTVPEATIISVFVYAGSAQLAVLPLLVTGDPMLIIWGTALLVNLRFVIFAAATRRMWTRMSPLQRIVAGYFHGDIGFAVFVQRYGLPKGPATPEQLGFYTSVAAINWAIWQVSSIGGILLGDLAPAAWGLELGAVLALLAVLIPLAATFPAVAGVLVSAVVGVLTVAWPMRLGLVVAIVAGLVVAMVAESWRPDATAVTTEPRVVPGGGA